MSSADPYIQCIDHGDGSADFTVTFAEDDYRFSVAGDGGQAVVEYEETLSWRGEMRNSIPDEDVFKALMQSDRMTQFLEEHSLNGVVRAPEYR